MVEGDMIFRSVGISMHEFERLYPKKEEATMLKGKITKIDGEYWLKIRHAGLKVMFQLVVRGKVATTAMEEILKRQRRVTK